MAIWKLVSWLVADVRQADSAADWLLVTKTLPVLCQRVPEPVAQQKLSEYDVQTPEASPREAVVWPGAEQNQVLIAGAWSGNAVQSQEASHYQHGQHVLAVTSQLVEAEQLCHWGSAKQTVTFSKHQQPFY